MSPTVDTELAALVRRLHRAEERLRDDATADQGASEEARARAEGMAAGLALAGAWVASLRDRLPELERLASVADGGER